MNPIRFDRPKSSSVPFLFCSFQPLLRTATLCLINAETGDFQVSGNATYRELTRNRRVGQRERGLHESFSLVSPYSSVSKPRGGFPSLMGKEPRTWVGAQLR